MPRSASDRLGVGQLEVNREYGRLGLRGLCRLFGDFQCWGLDVVLDIKLNMFVSNPNFFPLLFPTLNRLIRVTTFLTRHFLCHSCLGFHSKQRLIREQLETACFWHEQVVEVVHVALNLANDMQLVVLDLGVEALLVGEELDFEGLVEYLEGVVGDCVGFG